MRERHYRGHDGKQVTPDGVRPARYILRDAIKFYFSRAKWTARVIAEEKLRADSTGNVTLIRGEPYEITHYPPGHKFYDD